MLRFVFIATLFLIGCDTFYIKRFDLHKPNDISLIANYETNKAVIISTIERYSSEKNMTCKPRAGVFLECSLQPNSVVVFEDNNGVSICLFMLGVGLESEEFSEKSALIENELNEKLYGTTLVIPIESSKCNNQPINPNRRTP